VVEGRKAVAAVGRKAVAPVAVAGRRAVAGVPAPGTWPAARAVADQPVAPVLRVASVRPVAAARIPRAAADPARRRTSRALVSAGTRARPAVRRQAAPVPGTSGEANGAGGATGTGKGGSRALTARAADPELADREGRSRPTGPDLPGQAGVRKVAADPRRRRDRGLQERRERGPGEHRGRGPGERRDRGLAERRDRGAGERWDRGLQERLGRGAGERRDRGLQERRERGAGERRERGPGERRDRGLQERRDRGPGERRGRGLQERLDRGPGERRDRGAERDQAGLGPSSAAPLTGGLRFRQVSPPTSSTPRRARS
jgi:hypothetical protein